MTVTPNGGYFEALWPRGPRQVGVKNVAPRLRTLEGKRVAQLWDYVFRGDEVFAALEEGLRTRFPNVSWVNYADFGSTHGRNEREIVAAIPGKLKELGVDAVISGMGC
jgi:hypothetical protein